MNKVEEKIQTEEIQEIAKAIYKSVLKVLKSKDKSTAGAIVDDILDPNNNAEVDPDSIPSGKENVVNKSEKGIYKLRKFIEKTRK